MLIDTTLREGMQARGVYLSPKERIELALRLANAGIEEIEIGWARRGEDLRELVETTMRVGARPLVWSMARKISLEEAARSGCPAVTLCLPASRHHQEERFSMTPNQVEDWLWESVGEALKRFDFVQVGLEDASRTDRAALISLSKIARLAGADRLRLADTVGLFSPTENSRMVRDVQVACGMDICVHLHNDLGMATAGAVTALEVGASAVDGSLLGLGERAGIASTEELAAWAVMRRGSRYDLRAIREACFWLARTSGLEILRNKAVVGDEIFAAESGIHVDAIGRDPSLYEPWSPERTGHRRMIGVGAKSGRAAVRRKLREMGLTEPVNLEPLVEDVREAGAKLRRPLEEEELKRLHGRN